MLNRQHRPVLMPILKVNLLLLWPRKQNTGNRKPTLKRSSLVLPWTKSRVLDPRVREDDELQRQPPPSTPGCLPVSYILSTIYLL